MPGLIRGVARTAVVAGTASAVAGRVNHHQQEKWAAQDQAQYGQPAYAAPPQYAAPPAYAPPPQYAAPQYAEPAPTYAAPPAPAPAPAAAAPEVDRIAQLQKLGDLHTAGILTDAEFAAEKAKILAS